jgi:hypothetical protein
MAFRHTLLFFIFKSNKSWAASILGFVGAASSAMVSAPASKW